MCKNKKDFAIGDKVTLQDGRVGFVVYPGSTRVTVAFFHESGLLESVETFHIDEVSSIDKEETNSAVNVDLTKIEDCCLFDGSEYKVIRFNGSLDAQAIEDLTGFECSIEYVNNSSKIWYSDEKEFDYKLIIKIPSLFNDTKSVERGWYVAKNVSNDDVEVWPPYEYTQKTHPLYGIVSRVKDENVQLKERLNKLGNFVGTSAYYELKDYDRRLLDEQFRIMCEYAGILSIRQERLENQLNEDVKRIINKN